jgi:hypothetical protein
MYYLNNTRFDGASGPVRFTGANRISAIEIIQFQPNETTIGFYNPIMNDSDRLTVKMSGIVWPSGQKPSDGNGKL